MTPKLWPQSMEQVTLTVFPSRNRCAFWTVASTPAACSPPITEIRELGHMYIKRGLQKDNTYTSILTTIMEKSQLNLHENSNSRQSFWLLNSSKHDTINQTLLSLSHTSSEIMFQGEVMITWNSKRCGLPPFQFELYQNTWNEIFSERQASSFYR